MTQASKLIVSRMSFEELAGLKALVTYPSIIARLGNRNPHKIDENVPTVKKNLPLQSRYLKNSENLIMSGFF